MSDLEKSVLELQKDSSGRKRLKVVPSHEVGVCFAIVTSEYSELYTPSVAMCTIYMSHSINSQRQGYSVSLCSQKQCQLCG